MIYALVEVAKNIKNVVENNFNYKLKNLYYMPFDSTKNKKIHN